MMTAEIVPILSELTSRSGLVQQYSSTAHVMLHVATIIIATFLLGISLIAYVRVRRRKLLFLSGALFLFAIKEYVLFSDVTLLTSFDLIIPEVGAPITHVMNLLILIFIFLGIFFD